MVHRDHQQDWTAHTHPGLGVMLQGKQKFSALSLGPWHLPFWFCLDLSSWLILELIIFLDVYLSASKARS